MAIVIKIIITTLIIESNEALKILSLKLVYRKYIPRDTTAANVAHRNNDKAAMPRPITYLQPPLAVF